MASKDFLHRPWNFPTNISTFMSFTILPRKRVQRGCNFRPQDRFEYTCRLVADRSLSRHVHLP
jgi:hypothetical protein